MKAEALAWLRFGKRMQAVCTELKVYGGSWIPDVIGASPTAVVEVEVKISINDLRRDFGKAAKLFRYQKAEETQATSRVPNYFYYMVPLELRDAAHDVIKENLPQAGLIVWRPDFHVLPGKNLEIVKAAARLHTQPPSQTFLHEVFLRTSSELASARVAMVSLQNEVEQMLQRVDDAVVAQAARHTGVLDVEEPKLDLEGRAAQLAAAVYPGASFWPDVSDLEKQKWRDAAQRLLESQRQAPETWHQALRR